MVEREQLLNWLEKLEEKAIEYGVKAIELGAPSSLQAYFSGYGEAIHDVINAIHENELKRHSWMPFRLIDALAKRKEGEKK